MFDRTMAGRRLIADGIAPLLFQAEEIRLRHRKTIRSGSEMGTGESLMDLGLKGHASDRRGVPLFR